MLSLPRDIVMLLAVGTTAPLVRAQGRYSIVFIWMSIWLEYGA